MSVSSLPTSHLDLPVCFVGHDDVDSCSPVTKTVDLVPVVPEVEVVVV